MKHDLKAKTLIAGATISIASIFGLASCSEEPSSAGELLNAANQSLAASGFKAEKGLSYQRHCYAPNPNSPMDMLAGNSGCNVIFTGAAVKGDTRYQMEMACNTDAKVAKDCRIYKLTAF